MKRFIGMKYEQWLMRLFDWVVERLNKTMPWYPSFSIGADKKIEELEKQVWDLEDEIAHLIDVNENLEAENFRLDEENDWYRHHV